MEVNEQKTLQFCGYMRGMMGGWADGKDKKDGGGRDGTEMR